MLSQAQVLSILQALADSNRLHLFEMLLKSDLNNSELAEKTGLRQNLLSHHLNMMLSCGLIRVHQSLGDARRHYYSVNLAIVKYLGEWWDARNPHAERPLPSLKQPQHVLFVCLNHTTRSVIAEHLARHLAPDALVPFSAGLRHVPESPLLHVARRGLAESGITVDDVAPKTYHDVVATTTLDYVIAVCDIVHEGMLPPELAQTEYLHWSLRDPGDGATDKERLAITRELVNEIRLRIALFVRRLALEEEQPEIEH